MAWQIPLSTNTSIQLGTTDSVVIARQVVVNNGISGNGLDQEVRVKGTVAGGFAVSLGDLNAVGLDTNYIVRVSADGEIYGTSSAVQLYGLGNTLWNQGHIESFGDYGVYIRGVGADKRITITNAGDIVSDGDGSAISIASSNTQTVVLNNSGLVDGGDTAYGPNSTTPLCVDLISNTGQMIGDIQLGGLNDLYDGRTGQLIGIVYGEDGNDRLYGGSENNELRGDAGTDTLIGGAGADTLYGGADADAFAFLALTDTKTTAAKQDEIFDFSAVDSDQIDLHKIDANTVSKKDQSFDFIGQHGFTKHAGELIEQKKAGETYISGDVNGDGKADFTIHLAGDLDMAAGDFIL
jgi:Ca2+-binding RTX toxin-like protein